MKRARSHGACQAMVDDGGGEGETVLSFVANQATVQKSGIVFPQDLSERSWEEIGVNLRDLTNSSAWWLADWLIFGEATYGWRRYREAVERTGLDYQTLRNYAWVARRFEPARRRDKLSFAHHAEVARMSPSEQGYWLRKAEQLKWSRNELRKSIRASLIERREHEATTPDTTTETRPLPRLVKSGDSSGGNGDEVEHTPSKATLTIELSVNQLDHYSRMAEADGLSVDEWATQVLDAVDRNSA